MAENAASIGKYIEQETVNKQILPFYVTLLGDSEPEVRSEAVNRLFELAQNCDTGLIVQKVLPSLKLQLATESSQHVKGSMSYAVCKLAECVSQDEATTHLIPMVSILLKNNSTEVIVSLVENLEPLFKVIGEGALVEKLIPAIINLSNDKTWRIRLAVVQFIPKMAKYVERALFSSKIENTLLQMLMDPVFMIREETGKSCIDLSKSIYDSDWLCKIVETKLDEFSKHERFMIRIQSVHFITQMHKEVPAEYVNRKLCETLLVLAEDPVPNIRFNVSKAFAAMHPIVTSTNKGKITEVLQKMAESDQDYDSKFFA